MSSDANGDFESYEAFFKLFDAYHQSMKLPRYRPHEPHEYFTRISFIRQAISQCPKDRLSGTRTAFMNLIWPFFKRLSRGNVELAASSLGDIRFQFYVGFCMYCNLSEFIRERNKRRSEQQIAEQLVALRMQSIDTIPTEYSVVNSLVSMKNSGDESVG